MSMFCYQCQEAAKGKGCTIKGICGKDEETAKAQDLLIYVCKGIAALNLKARALGIPSREADKFIIDSLFTTITNANFDKDMIYDKVRNGLKLRVDVQKLLMNAGVKLIDSRSWFKKTMSFWGLARKEKTERLPEAAVWYGTDKIVLEGKAGQVGVLSTEDEDIRSLRELLIYGLKGLAAYVKHADNLGYSMDELHDFVQNALVATLDDGVEGEPLTAEQLTVLVLQCGKFGFEAMELLDKANTSSFGNPEITKVNIGVGTNPGILVSGHDLRDLEELLKQTEGMGIDIYTHGEMLPANCYPEFKKYKHLVGNYGNSWWKQHEEFESFNGPILMTTNCIISPKDSYKNRIYTTGVTGFPGVLHISDAPLGEAKDFSRIIEQAKTCQPPVALESGEIVGGFAHNQLTDLSDKIIEAVKSGVIKRFFVMAGCDGRAKSRNYYTEFAKKLPKDTVILTAGCAKYRYNKLDLGDINGIPRVLDAGQCNDSYSLALIALKLKEALELDDINKLPISYNIAWYEQKAVIVLLALLNLGIKNIHLGPTLPAFLSSNVAKILVEDFGITGITSSDEDIKMFMES